ncbi:MAG: neutral/alkaline non-lysosomal ceramidase N-terminal domain-containing protein [Chitinophagales bacterium]
MYQVGTAKVNITPNIKDVGMMGYGMWFNIVEDTATPLFARAYVVEDSTSKKKFAFVCAEFAFITTSIKRGVMKILNTKHERLNFTNENVLLTAQHTHSAPGGFSHYGLYNMSIPGFVPEVYDCYVEGIAKAIVEASEKMKPARIKLKKGSFAEDVNIAFNRSINAYNRNPEVKTPLGKHETHKAVNREMTLLQFKDEQGQAIGSINWFGLHCTSISNDNKKICSDNKGYAAQYTEDAFAKDNPDYNAIFAQNYCGDISPNYIWDRKKGWTRGSFEDDYKSAQYSGKLQSDKALEIIRSEKSEKLIKGEIDSAMIYVNFAEVYPYPEFTGGKTDVRTGPSCHGVAFLKGTAEGPGMPVPLAFAANRIVDVIKVYEMLRQAFVDEKERERIRLKYKVQGVKKVMIESGERKMLGTWNIKRLVIPDIADPSIRIFKEHHRKGALEEKPWTPQVLPLQIIILGNIALVSIPGEITTIAAQRLEKTILDVLKQRGVEEIILNSYANSYCGYITTQEEYQEQCYEGGHTVFGEYTLAAFQSKYQDLAKEMIKKPELRKTKHTIKPVKFTPEELALRSYEKKLIS